MNKSVAWLSRLLPASFLLLSGCGGLGNYVSDTFWRAGNPHAPKTNTLTVERARGDAVPVPLILPQQGDIWPNAIQTVPTLGDLERRMNAPSSAAAGYDAAPSVHARNGRLPPSAAPASNQSSVAMTPRIRPAHPVAPPPATAASPFRLGDTVMTPNGPGGVVSSDNTSGYQTVAPIGGRGGGILVPTGNGSATLIGPNGQVSPVIK